MRAQLMWSMSVDVPRELVYRRITRSRAGLSKNYTFMSSRACILSTLSAVALFAEWGDRHCGRCRLCGISSSSHGPSLRAGGCGLGARGRSHRTRVTTLTVGQPRMDSVRATLSAETCRTGRKPSCRFAIVKWMAWMDTFGIPRFGIARFGAMDIASSVS